ncbi:MAG: CNNM domain-containing protein, partial [Methylophilaceae bacterium]|nr:CNNM domain-containing protein [Methylophilaceae bacterium]
MDNIPLSWQFGGLTLLLFLSAFFSMSETALMSINRYRLRHLVKEGHRGAKLTHALLLQTDKLLGVILLCNNFVNTALATLVTIITVNLFGEGKLALMYSTIVVTFAILIFSEISPKIIAAAYAEKVGVFVSYILYPLLRVLYPVVWFVNLFVEAWLKILGIKINFNDGVKS